MAYRQRRTQRTDRYKESQNKTQLEWVGQWKRRETQGLVNNEDNKGVAGNEQGKANETSH